jgi:subtilisin
MSDPAWSDAFAGELAQVLPLPLPKDLRSWAWGGANGRGVKVAVVDSGIEEGHPRVGALAGAMAVEYDPESPKLVRFVAGPHDDLVGHGTACAGIIRAAAPEAELYSVRVLGSTLRGRGGVFAAGLEWAIESGMQVVNLSLSTGNADWFGPLHELADTGYFRRTVLVCAINNVPGPSYPSQFSSVISVAAHLGKDPERFDYNSNPPVEFGAPGIDVEVAWRGGGTLEVTGNSFAAPHISGLVTRLLSKHPTLTPFQVKSVLHALATNAQG